MQRLPYLNAAGISLIPKYMEINKKNIIFSKKGSCGESKPINTFRFKESINNSKYYTNHVKLIKEEDTVFNKD
jgi:hypothetical protein